MSAVVLGYVVHGATCQSGVYVCCRLVEALCKSLGSSDTLQLVLPSVIGQHKHAQTATQAGLPACAAAAAANTDTENEETPGKISVHAL